MNKKNLTIVLFAALIAISVYSYRGSIFFQKISRDSIIEAIEKKISAPEPLKSGAAAANSSSLTRQGIIVWTNKYRIENGLPPLGTNKMLDDAAQAKAKDMLSRQYFEHISPDGKGPAELVTNSGYEYITVGENLALGGFKDDHELVQGWMDSPGHRANILNTRYTEMGAASVKGVFEGGETWLSVQEFGLPLSACPAPDKNLKVEIENSKAELKRTSDELDAKLQEVENTRPKRGADYNRKVAEYNALIDLYNSLIEKTQSLIDSYNEKVEVLNVCIKGD
ncbi:hypothetical protein HYT01_04250 [Candidatus Giovannonibacteria bacterium]|nr:hypothetical protein [Candidatus Giovannonibacteria bacterium]